MKQRLEIIDFLRGFSIFTIVLALATELSN